MTLPTKPIIAIDIDDVLLAAGDEIVRNYNIRWGAELGLEHLYTSDNLAPWGVTDIEDAIRRMDVYLESPEYFALPPMKEAIHALRRLSEKYELHVLTGRKEVMEAATRHWLGTHFPDIFISINFSNMFNTAKTRTKGEICVELGAVVLIDDHIGHCQSAIEHGLKAVLFGDYPWNQTQDLPVDITRCKDWAAVESYFDARS